MAEEFMHRKLVDSSVSCYKSTPDWPSAPYTGMANLLVGCLHRLVFVWGQFWLCLIRWLRVSRCIATPRPHPPETLNRAKWGRHRYVHVHKVKLHYVENGSSSKPLMLFLHGLPDFWYTWRHQLREFSADYWTVAVDLPGFGRSEQPGHPITYRLSNLARAVCELVSELGKSDCILVGNGCGALVGWHVINQYPERVSKYVMMGLPSAGVLQDLYDENAIPLSALLKFAFLSSQLASSAGLKLAAVGDYALFDRLLGAYVNPQDLEAYKYTFSQPGALARVLEAFRENWDDFFVEDSEFRVRKTADMPGLLLVGENDRWIPFERVSERSISKYHPLETRCVAGTGRYLHQEDPRTVNRLMGEFLGRKASTNRPPASDNGVTVQVVHKEVCHKCHLLKNTTGVGAHDECAKNCDGLEHKHFLSKPMLPICS